MSMLADIDRLYEFDQGLKAKKCEMIGPISVIVIDSIC